MVLTFSKKSANIIPDMKTTPALHPYVTTSACHILNPPKKFGFRDAKRIGMKVLKVTGFVLGWAATFAAIYACFWIAWAFASLEKVGH